jgi:hypothetical protein
MNLAGVSGPTIVEMDTLIGQLRDERAFGILSYGKIQTVHQTVDVEAGLHQGMTHTFEMLFCTSAHRDFYLPDSRHLAVATALLEKGLKVDANNICIVDTNYIIENSGIVKLLLTDFCKRHDIESIVEAFPAMGDPKQCWSAAQELITIARGYLIGEGEQDAFWASLISRAEDEKLIPNPARQVFKRT